MRYLIVAAALAARWHLPAEFFDGAHVAIFF
jgi:hypothetical protein